MSKRPVFYIARMLPSYRIPILERLNERIGGRLVVFHGDPPGNSSMTTLTETSEAAFRIIRLKNRWFGGQKIHMQEFSAVFHEQPQPAVMIVEESPRSITLPLVMLRARRTNIPVILWGHFSSNNRAFSPKNLLDRYRLLLARRADACLCYSDEIFDMLRAWIPEKRLFVARNTLDMRHHRAWRESLMREGRSAVRDRLGLADDALVLAFIGRLDSAKGADRLLPIFRSVSERRSAALVVIGDGPARSYFEAGPGSENVFLTGALTPERAAPWLFAADIMLLPGQAGLAVNHAFAYGLPVVIRDSPHEGRFHGPEAGFVRPGENAEIAAGGETEAFARAVESIGHDLDRYSRNALHFAETELDPDIMIDGMLAAIKEAENRD